MGRAGYGAVLGDLHLGKTLYGYDTTHHVKAAMWAFFEFCKAQQVSYAVQLGDVFDTPTPKEEHRKLFVDWLNEFEKLGIKLFVLVGNHDVLSRGAPSALESIKAMPWESISIVSKPKLALVAPEHTPVLMFAPFPSPVLFKDSASWEKECYQRIPKGKKALLFTHSNIDGATFGDQDIVYRGADHCLPSKVIKHSSIQAVIAGHIHKPQRFGKTILIGAAERLRFDEKNQARYFGLIDRNGKVKLFNRTKALSMTEISVDTSCWDKGGLEPTTEGVLEYLAEYDVKGLFVKVVPYVSETCSVAWGEVSKALYQMGALHVNVAAPIKVRKDVSEEKKLAYSVTDPVKAAASFIKSQVRDKQEQKKLFRLFKQLREEIDHA